MSQTPLTEDQVPGLDPLEAIEPALAEPIEQHDEPGEDEDQ